MSKLLEMKTGDYAFWCPVCEDFHHLRKEQVIQKEPLTADGCIWVQDKSPEANPVPQYNGCHLHIEGGMLRYVVINGTNYSLEFHGGKNVDPRVWPGLEMQDVEGKVSKFEKEWLNITEDGKVNGDNG